MIVNLRIKNVALIDEVEVAFAPGLNVLSGETGAGKSIVVDSINFLLGGRTSRDLIRTGAPSASVEGIFDTDNMCRVPRVLSKPDSASAALKQGLIALGIELDGGQLMLSRAMQADTGKSTCRINGRTVTVGVLKSAAELLVELHGQHEHQSLLDPAKQLEMLDYFCGDELAEMKTALAGHLSRYKEATRELKKIEAGTSAEQLEIWRFQLNEIEAAALKPGEEDALTAKRDRLAGLERLSRNTSDIVALLYAGFFEGRPSMPAADATAKAVALAAEIARIDPSKEHLHTALVDVNAVIREIGRDFRDYEGELDADPHALDAMETRLDTIYRLKKKYGATVETILMKRDDLAQKLDSVENAEVEARKIRARRKEISAEITAVCATMNAIRTAHAARLSAEITEILRDLGMQHAELFIQIKQKTVFAADGNDEIEFMISPNPGEPAKPLRKIASGGEMSRIMLAIKTIMSDRVPTVIFDEVDTGVSGRTAQQVAEKLAAVSRTRQILCITHLPQIAAMADTHFLIEKAERTGRTITSVAPLCTDGTIRELARLTGGAAITSATLQSASEMKSQADALKKI
ncbi:MAG: DNA repair protein RecN [Defluviitaleaceae bacterium]|nr:DNA repair protein RecN [Defluviitaleaceae bacterium]